MDVKALYEDDDLVVFEKPSGLIINNSDTTRDVPTLQKIVQERHAAFLKNESEDEEFLDRSGIVHRLDKETSGIIIVAKNPVSFQNLKNQFKERRVEKEYLALVHGEIKNENGEISVPVGRLPWNRKRFGVVAGGREAKTFYKVLRTIDKNGEILTLLRVMPKTGRTHQIRVHLKHVGYPIYSDLLYAGRKIAKKDRSALPTIFLHAHKIVFFHPKTGERISIESKLPEVLESFLG